jgi:hypothetical protein
VDYYKSLGVGTFQPEVVWDNITYYKDYKVRGKPAKTTIKNRMRALQIGPLPIELFQPVEGETTHTEFLNSIGEGLSTLAFIVDDLAEETAKLVKQGFEVISSAKTEKGATFAYFDTRKVGNVMIELIEHHQN